MDKSYIRNATLARIVNLNDRKIVSIHGHLEGLLIAWAAVLSHIKHIRQQEGCTLLLDCIGEISERLGYISTVCSRLKLNDLADNMQKVTSSLLRRNEFLHLIAEEQGTDLIIIEYG